MQPSRARLICRSHNPFTPSIALWQHFVLANRPIQQQQQQQQRLSSSAASEAEPSATPVHESNAPPPTPLNPSEPSDSLHHGKNRRSVIHKVPWKTPLPSPDDSATLMAKTKQDNADYKGVVVQPMRGKMHVRESAFPWALTPKEQLEMEGTKRLNVEIEKFYEYAIPSRAEAAARRHVIEKVRSHARETLPDHILEIFGSERSGLALATSDLDLRLLKTQDVAESASLTPWKAERLSLLHDLYRLKRKLVRKNDYMLVTFRHARYPLISLQDRATRVDVQIVLSNDTSLSRAVMQKYMRKYPYLRHLYSVVKTIFDIRGLSDVFRGGFGSYSIFMMIVASLRHTPPRTSDAAGGLLKFLEFWSTFDTTTKGISIEPISLFDKAKEVVMTEETKRKLKNDKIPPLPAYMLSLRDPADHTNDLGRKGVCIKHLQETLKALGKQLQEDLLNNNRPSLLTHLVGPVYALNVNRRKLLDEQGKRFLSNTQGTFAAKAKWILESEKASIFVEAPRPFVSEPFHDHGDAITSTFGMPLAEDLAKDQATHDEQEILNSETASGSVDAGKQGEGNAGSRSGSSEAQESIT